MEKATLLILSGLPGSGKSTLAAKLAAHFGAVYLRIDTVEQGLREVCGIQEIEGMGYRLSYRIARENLTPGQTVIADCVNPWELTRQEWNEVASEIGARFLNIEVSCSDLAEHQSRVEARTPNVSGLKPPTWAEVCLLDYHAWSEGVCLQLDTSRKSEEESFAELLMPAKRAGV